MDGFALPLAVFAVFLVWLLVEMLRGFEDPYPLRAGTTWAVTCPLAGLLFGVGLAPLALIVGIVSVLALGSLAYWFLGAASDDAGDETLEPVAPDPEPSDDDVIELPAWARRPEPEPEPGIDWDAFDRARADWEKEFTIPATEPERELLPSGV